MAIKNRLQAAQDQFHQTEIAEPSDAHSTFRLASFFKPVSRKNYENPSGFSSRFQSLWQQQGSLWMGFAFSGGILAYSLLPDEPYWQALAIPFGLLAGVALNKWIRSGLGAAALLGLCFWAGVTLMSVRTAAVQAPRLAEPITATLTGRVENINYNVDRTRIVLSVRSVNGKSVVSGGFPKSVRLRVASQTSVQVGDHIQVNARLFPPAGPVVPGGYDFSFRAYYAGIGASGFAFGTLEPLKTDNMTVSVRLRRFLDNTRGSFSAHIKTRIDSQPEAALAVALLVGDRSGITEEDEEILRQAGLAHILAISGLHMALFAGGTYAVCLGLLALVPVLALNWPIQKLAAVTAFMAAVMYLLISGASVATQRSFLMISLVFLGVALGRRSLTFRSVALAGCALLIVAPERLFFPGFQMSFAAVIALVAVYDAWRRRRGDGLKAKTGANFMARSVHAFATGVVGLFVTACVAGLATGIIGAHHFGRIAPYGVVGNMLGMPVFSLIVMPMGVLAFALMPLGLASLPLNGMAVGLYWIRKVAGFTAQLGEEAGLVGNIPWSAALGFVSALFLMLMLSGRLRLLGLVPAVVGVLIVSGARPPDIQISSSGKQIAVRSPTGVLTVSSRRKTFQNEIWLQAEGVGAKAIKSRAIEGAQKHCDPDGCVFDAYGIEGGTLTVGPLKIAVPKSMSAMGQDCKYADIIVSDLIARMGCGRAGSQVRPLVLSTARGAISIWLHKPQDNKSRTQQTAGETAYGSAVHETHELWKPGLEKISYAIASHPRRWHSPGTITRQSLRNR